MSQRGGYLMKLQKTLFVTFCLGLICLSACSRTKSESEIRSEELIAYINEYSDKVSTAQSISQMNDLSADFMKPIEEMADDQTELNSESKKMLSEALFNSLWTVTRRMFVLSDREDKLKDEKFIGEVKEVLKSKADSLVEGCSTIGQLAEKLAANTAE